MLKYPHSPLVVFSVRCALLCLILLLAGGCATGKKKSGPTYLPDREEMMESYTPRDDGLPLTPDELYAFKTVSDLDRGLSEEDARIVELHFKFFVHQRRGTFERFLERSARFMPYIKKTFAERGIPEDIAYLCMVESGGNPNARSPVGAMGLWQFMPFTGRKFGLTQNNWIDERRDPYKATYAASDYLLKLYGDFSNWHLAVAAYNAGEGKIGRAVSGTGANDFFELCRLDCQLEERARLRDETRDYVPRLIAIAKIMRNLKRLGFTPPPPDTAWTLRPMDVPPGTNLTGLAGHLNLTWDEFSAMNPAYRRTASPPTAVSTAYVPPDKMAQAVAWVASGEAKAYADWREYTVKKGDSLASIAKRHKVSVAAIKEANGIGKLPARGSTILIPGKGQSAPAQPSGTPAPASGTYVVKSGDTLFGLAGAWGTNVAAIRAANNMGPSENALGVGRRLVVPGGSKRAPAPVPVAAAPRAAAPVAAPVADRPAVSGSSYTVRAGDTVSGIARAAGVSVKALCGANGLNADKPIIRPGQQLAIPGKGATPAPVAAAPAAPPAKAASVTVKSGDTLYSIARANNVSVQALQKANNLGGTKLKIGQKLLLP